MVCSELKDRATMMRASIADLIEMFRHSVLVRRSSVMLAGVIGAKVVGALALLVLARLYSTEAFGILGLLQALVSIIFVVASLSYHAAIALPSREEEAASIFWLALGFLTIATIVTAGAAVILGDPLSRALDAPALSHLIWWAPGLLLGLGLYEVLSHWLTRSRAFKRLASSRVMITVAVAAAQIVAWFIGAALAGLVVGLVLGTGFAAGILAVQIWRTYRSPLMAGLSWPRIRQVAQTYQQFPTYQAPASLLNAASTSMIPLGLGFFFGPVVVGIYWLAARVCGYLTNLVRQTMQQIFLNRAAEVENESADVRNLFERTTLGLGALALPPTALLVVAGPFVFAIAFGADWVEAGVYARWLAIAWLFSLVNIPAVQLAAVYRLQRWTLLYSLGLTLFRGGAIIIGGIVGDPILVIFIYASGDAMCSIAFLLAIGRYLRRRTSPPHQTAAVQTARIK